MLHDDDVVVTATDFTDDLGCLDTLLDIQVGGRLVKHINADILHRHNHDGGTLQLST
jgi:hypothetical protein